MYSQVLGKSIYKAELLIAQSMPKWIRNKETTWSGHRASQKSNLSTMEHAWPLWIKTFIQSEKVNWKPTKIKAVMTFLQSSPELTYNHSSCLPLIVLVVNMRTSFWRYCVSLSLRSLYQHFSYNINIWWPPGKSIACKVNVCFVFVLGAKLYEGRCYRQPDFQTIMVPKCPKIVS